MCGIAGIYAPGVDIELLRNKASRMAKELHHRGPDSHGIWGEKHCALAHTRLSIIDLSSAAHQPMVHDSHALSFNGEIYNYLELRAQLKAQGVVFRSTSDTEVLFYALIHWGVEITAKRLRGMFAFAYWNGHTETLHLVRDRYGIKPLFWCQRGGMTLFGSEIKALRSVMPIQIDPIRTAFAASGLTDQYNRHTLFSGVEHLAPGTILTLHANTQPSFKQFYTFTDDVNEAYFHELDGGSSQDIEQRFHELMRASTKSMLMSDVPMGVFLSGGLDSSLIAAHASAVSPSIEFLTSNVQGPLSEVESARDVAMHLRHTLHESPFEPHELLTHLVACTSHLETPSTRHPSSMPMAKLAHLARHMGIKPVLTGEGADELFLGYPRDVTNNLKPLGRAPFTLLKSIYDISPSLYPFLFPEHCPTAANHLEMLVQNYERQTMRDVGCAAYDFLPVSKREAHYASIRQLREGLLSLLVRNDRMGMQASIESRFPFLDEELVRFAINLPIRFKNAITWRFFDRKHPFVMDKAVVRHNASKLIPKSIAYRVKNGFPVHGYDCFRIKPGFFAKGFVGDLFSLTAKGEQYLLAHVDRTFVGRLACIEVFGRLFAQGESQEQTHEAVMDNISMEGVATTTSPYAKGVRSEAMAAA